MRLNWRIKYRQLLYWDYLVCLWHEYHFFYVQRLSIVVLGESFCVISVSRFGDIVLCIILYNAICCIYISLVFLEASYQCLYIYLPLLLWTSLIHSYCHPLGEGSFNPRCSNNWSVTDHCQLWPTMVTNIYIL